MTAALTPDMPRPYFTTLLVDHVGKAATIPQPVFCTGQQTITLPTGAHFSLSGLYYISGLADAQQISVLFAGTAEISITGDISYATEPGHPTQQAGCLENGAATIEVKTDAIFILLTGTLAINAGGTVTPQFRLGNTPKAAPTVKANSFLRFGQLAN